MRVKIYKPSKTATQSGQAQTHDWIIEPDMIGARLPEPLMGWQSSTDTLNQIKLSFSSQEEAVRFAASKNWTYRVVSEKQKKVKPRSYSDNFKD